MRTHSPLWGRRRSRRAEGLGEGATPPPRESLAALEEWEQSKQRTFYKDFTTAVTPELSLRGASSAHRGFSSYRTGRTQLPNLGFQPSHLSPQSGILSRHFYLSSRSCSRARMNPKMTVGSFQKEGAIRSFALVFSGVETWNQEGEWEQRAGLQPWSCCSPALLLMEQRVGRVCLSVSAPPNQCTQR